MCKLGGFVKFGQCWSYQLAEKLCPQWFQLREISRIRKPFDDTQSRGLCPAAFNAPNFSHPLLPSITTHQMHRWAQRAYRQHPTLLILQATSHRLPFQGNALSALFSPVIFPT